jgi:hypothetical protein
MTQDLDELRLKWNVATANLKYGEQRVFIDVLTLVAEDKKHDLVWGKDYGDGGACLVNAAGNLLTTGGGHGIPMANFGAVVGLYDTINRIFYGRDINTDNHVSPLAAEILLQWFAPLKPTPLETEVNDAMANEAFAEGLSYTEPTDEDMTRALMEMLSEAPPAVENNTQSNDVQS